MNRQRSTFSHWWRFWWWLLGCLIVCILGLTVVAGFLAGNERWSAMLTGSAAMIAAAAVLASLIATQRSVQPLPIIEWHEGPDIDLTKIVFRNEGVGTAILQDVMIAVVKEHPSRADTEHARHSWAQLVIRPHEVIHTVLEKNKMARTSDERIYEPIRRKEGYPTAGVVKSVTVTARLCNVHGDDLGRISVPLDSPFRYGVDTGNEVGNWWESSASGTPVIRNDSYQFYSPR